MKYVENFYFFIEYVFYVFVENKYGIKLLENIICKMLGKGILYFFYYVIFFYDIFLICVNIKF